MPLMRLFFAALVVLCCVGAAGMRGSGGGGNVCPAVSADGSTITPANLSCQLIDGSGNTWQFSSNLAPNNSQLNFNGAPTFAALSAHMCGTVVYFNTDESTNVGQPLGTSILWFASGAHPQENGQCNAATANARNTTTSTNYGMPVAALAAAAANQTITAIAMPVGVPWYFGGGLISADHVVFSPAIGAKFFVNYFGSGGTLDLQFNTGTNATINGGEYGWSGQQNIRVESIAINPTFDGSGSVPLILHDAVDTCILTGSDEQTITVKDLIVYNCARGNPGQAHNAYFSTDGTATDNTVVNITGIRSYDVIGGGWTLKMRVHKSTVIGDAANYYIGCQSSLQTKCEQNGAIDFPCGGIHNFSNLVIERGPGGDNWYNVRANEEVINPSVGNCPATGYVGGTNVTLDHVILIDDSPSTGAGPSGSVALCLGGSLCTNSNVSSNVGTVSNSVIIRNPNSTVAMQVGPGITSMNNTIYASRQTACDDTPVSGPARGSNWHNLVDIFGNNSGTTCAFPWVPPYPSSALQIALAAMSPDQFKLISTGTDGGFSAAGTPNDCAHFDGAPTVGGTACSGTGTFPSLASLQSIITSPNFNNNFCFSGGGIRASDHIIGFHGGGHACPQHDSGFYKFDIDAAVNALCTPTCFTGSRTGGWKRVVDSGRLLDVFTQSRPAWSPQQQEGTPTGTLQYFWMTTNQSGQQMWDACHTYHSVKAIPNTTDFDVSCGGTFGGSNNIGGHWFVDTSVGTGTDTATVHGPFVTSSPVGHVDTTTGLAGGVTDTSCPDPFDGSIYTVGQGVDGNYDLFKWTNPLSSNPVPVNIATGPAIDTLQQQDCLLITDPTNASFRAMFVYHNLTPGSAEWALWTGLAGGTPTYHAGAFSGGIPTNCVDSGIAITLDTVTGTALVWYASGHVCKITFSATLANITISEITVSPTGDIPTAGPSGTNVPTVQFFHFPTADGLAMMNASQTWIYRCKNAGCT